MGLLRSGFGWVAAWDVVIKTYVWGLKRNLHVKEYECLQECFRNLSPRENGKHIPDGFSRALCGTAAGVATSASRRRRHDAAHSTAFPPASNTPSVHDQAVFAVVGVSETLQTLCFKCQARCWGFMLAADDGSVTDAPRRRPAGTPPCPSAGQACSSTCLGRRTPETRSKRRGCRRQPGHGLPASR